MTPGTGEETVIEGETAAKDAELKTVEAAVATRERDATVGETDLE